MENLGQDSLSAVSQDVDFILSTHICPDDAIDPDAEPIQPPGQSWNPILGVNRAAAGEGLNQADEERLDKT